MKTFLKTLIAIPLLLILLAVIFVATINPEHLVPHVEKQLAAQGIDASISGEVSWQFFPTIGLKIEEIALRSLNAEAAGSSATPLANVGKMGFGVKVMPLLKRKIHISSVQLSDLDLNLITQKNGQNNWTPGDAEPGDAEPETPSDTATSEAAEIPELNIETLAIKNLRVNIDDQQTGSSLALHDFSFLSHNINLEGKPFPSQLEFLLQVEGQEDIKLTAEFSPSVYLDDSKYQLADILAHISLGANRFKLTGDISAAIRDTGMKLDLALAMDELNLDTLFPASETVAEAEDTAAEPSPLPLEFIRSLESRVNFSVAKLISNNIAINDFGLKVTSLDGLVKIEQLQAQTLEGTLEVLATLDATARRGDSAKLEFTGSANSLNIGTLLEKMADNKNLAGNAHLKFKGGSTGGTADALIENLRADVSLNSEGLVLQPINIEKQFCKLMSLLDKGSNFTEKLETGSWEKATRLEPVEVLVQYAENKVKMENLVAQISDLNVTSNGTFDVESGTFNFPIALALGNAGKGPEACLNIDQKWLKRPLPLRCKGSLESLGIDTCLPDTDLIGSILKDKVDEKVDAEKARAKKLLEEKKAAERARLEEKADKEKARAKKKLGNKLKNLLNR